MSPPLLRPPPVHSQRIFPPLPDLWVASWSKALPKIDFEAAAAMAWRAAGGAGGRRRRRSSSPCGRPDGTPLWIHDAASRNRLHRPARRRAWTHGAPGSRWNCSAHAKARIRHGGSSCTSTSTIPARSASTSGRASCTIGEGVSERSGLTDLSLPLGGKPQGLSRGPSPAGGRAWFQLLRRAVRKRRGARLELQAREAAHRGRRR